MQVRTRNVEEIDTEPYNEVSLGFHQAMGFKEVGVQTVRNNSIKVSLQKAKVNKNLWIEVDNGRSRKYMG